MNKVMDDRLQVGIISSTHGIKGEVKVYPTTDDPKRFLKLKQVILSADRQDLELHIEGVKFFKKMVILKFREYNNINDIEQYKGCGLFVTRDNAVPLKQNEYFIADLIGMQVYDEEDTEIGILTEVIPTGANDVYSVRRQDETELLLPAIKECILNVDMQNRRMKVHIMDGLLP